MRANVPNLDCDSSIDLMAFWVRHQRGARSRELFPDGGRGTRTATGTLASYAANLHTARVCRLRGDINAATVYERIADNLYESLSASARW